MTTGLPNSSIMVLKVLETESSISTKSIVALTGLSPRTMRYAIKKLKEHHLIIEKLDMTDTRRTLYSKKPVEIQKCTP